jgi:hypothetical protein
VSCWNITEIIRRARTVGIIIELDAAGNLRLRAPSEPPPAMVQHLREHKRELTKFLKAKAATDRAEVRQAINAKAKVLKPGSGRARVGFGVCDRCGKPPTEGNELIAEGLDMSVHEKCWKGRGGRKPRFRPKTGGDGALSDNRGELLVPDNRDELLVPIPVGRAWRK